MLKFVNIIFIAIIVDALGVLRWRRGEEGCGHNHTDRLSRASKTTCYATDAAVPFILPSRHSPLEMLDKFAYCDEILEKTAKVCKAARHQLMDVGK